MSVLENLAHVSARIAAAGRSPDEVTIVAVTKGFDAGACREALASGLRILAENRVQEALSKMDAVDGATWHLIGHLQTNKVRHTVGRFALIQSVDSLHLVEAIARANPQQAVLVEVNIAREPQRSGVNPAHAHELIAAASNQVDLEGLMAMGPSHGDPGPAFQELRRLRDESEQRIGRALPTLSMGMSGDYEAAVAAGSTMLRLGQALFGPRPT